jgi:predicted porin
MPDISTNLAYLGTRGFQNLGADTSFQFIYQFEAGFDVSATPGLKETNSAQSNTVNGTLFNRNTFVGFSSPQYGAIKVGKTDAPYKQSTVSLNPFLGELGDNGAIMGNTGGDSRVEFGTRLDHSIWYESPQVHGFALSLLFSPGQNRDDLNGDIAAGESDCTGGNIPESGGDQPVLCNDGAWGNAFSGSLTYTAGPLYLVAASELHQHVNRQSDISGMYGTGAVLPNAYSQNLYDLDVANEWAAKFAIQYVTPTKTTLGAIVEYLHRDEAGALQFQNERTRYGSWLVVGQGLTPADAVYVGWGHAFRTPGDPGQHNDATIPTLDGLSTYAANENKADLFTVALKHRVTDDLTLYADWAMINNGPSAHYALGAGGRGVITDCHDASDAPGGADSDPHCYTGQTIMGVSTGVKYSF